MSRLAIPPARPVLYPMRSRDTADIHIHRLEHHRIRVTIDHQPLVGVTPEMLLYWFSNVGETMEYDGETWPRYLVWHPLDHIRWELARPDRNGGAGEGARFRIVEAFGRRDANYIDVVERVEKLDTTGIRLVQRVAGVKISQLEHTWSRASGATHYVSVLDVGARQRVLAPITRRVVTRMAPLDKLEAWATHNVEEVGLLEHILPGLAARASAPAL